ncbi:hypothetical protein [Mucilaginibacter psychrotolerans]|uniref:Uncharacterized protein n=1 Tax=Mucilaginibacter psychrotolerans TaxID=1524096 RepID=A0A4Y8S4E4_9SPHI|nr:hypothetical protein [Mucilaginibacter psychrotolerans]TFF33440.1 hypothetical protein E2R66_25865 [Mucilaginibacter psychrotolerans]
MKKLLLSIVLIVTALFTSQAQTAKPTRAETINYINQILEEACGLELKFTDGRYNNFTDMEKIVYYKPMYGAALSYDYATKKYSVTLGDVVYDSNGK